MKESNSPATESDSWVTQRAHGRVTERVRMDDLGGKLKVVSRFGAPPIYQNGVGSKALFHFDPTPVDKWVKSLIYKETEVGSHGSSVTLVTLDSTPT